MLKNPTWSKLNNFRIYIIFVLLFSTMSIFAPNFFNAFNISNILRTMVLNAIVIIGFTIVVICGHLDLSVLAVINLAGNITISLSLLTGNWFISIAVAVVAGAAIGLLNGILTTKAGINSFIVTLGMLTAVQGLVYLYNNGATVSTIDFTMADWLDNTAIPILANRAIIAIVLVLIFQFLLRRTAYGRSFYLIGGNIQTAWLAGIKTDRFLIAAFTLSGIFSALGGSIFACSLASAMANIGERGVNPLMIIIAATVLGGTSLSGGNGSIMKSFFGVLTLTVLFNALTCFKAGYEMQIFISGLVLMLVIFLEAYSSYRKSITKGQKKELL